MKFLKIDWGVLIFIVGYHLALLIGLPIYFIHHSAPLSIWIWSGVLMYISGLGVTGGYHRLYSHQSYKTNRFVEVFYLFFGTLATQGSALKWSHDHRNHHAYVDTDRDPYSIKKGFWFAHVLWLFKKPNPINLKVVADLQRNPLVAFQHKFYVPLMFLTNIAVFLLFGYLYNDYLTSFIFIWGVRLFFLHHFTWFINSLAHIWGSKSYSQEHSAVDNYIMSIFTFGEGYHNYHHTFANDYRNGTRWYHFDPTKWMIWTLSKFRLARSLRTVSPVRIKEKMVIEEKKELLAEKVMKYFSENRVLVEEKLEKITKDVIDKISAVNRLKQEYKNYKKKPKRNKADLKALSIEVKSMKRKLGADWLAWKRFSKALKKRKLELA